MAGSAHAPLADGWSVELEPVQLVAPDGTATSEARFSRDLPPETLGWLYEMMVVTRELDTEFINLQRQGELALYPSCRGRRPPRSAAPGALRATDWIFPQYRELGMFVVRGIDPGGVGMAWRGAWHGGFGFIERSVAPHLHPHRHPGAARGGRRHGLGVARRRWRHGGLHRRRRRRRGRRARGAQPGHGARRPLPVLRAEQRLGHLDAARRPVPARPRWPTRPIGYGMPGVRVDGNDVAACYVVVAEAAARARAGDGPTFIEAVTYRLGTPTSDDPKRYRSDDEVAAWDALDTHRTGPALPARAGRLERRARGPGPATRHGDADPARDAVPGRPRPPVPAGALRPRLLDAQPPTLIAQRATLAEELDAGA